MNFSITYFSLPTHLQDQGTPALTMDIGFTVVVTADDDPPPSFDTVVYSVSASEADYSSTVSFVEMIIKSPCV